MRSLKPFIGVTVLAATTLAIVAYPFFRSGTIAISGIEQGLVLVRPTV